MVLVAGRGIGWSENFTIALPSRGSDQVLIREERTFVDPVVKMGERKDKEGKKVMNGLIAHPFSCKNGILSARSGKG